MTTVGSGTVDVGNEILTIFRRERFRGNDRRSGKS